MVLVPYFVQNLAAASLTMDLFIGGRERYMSLGVKIRDTNIFYLYHNISDFGAAYKPAFSTCVLHRLVELICARSVLLMPKSLLKTHEKEIGAIHKEINYITACIHFAAIAHEKFGHVWGSLISEDLKAMLSREQEWDDQVVFQIQGILDKYKTLSGVHPVLKTHDITVCVMHADGSPFVCTVTQYVTNLLDVFIKHRTDNVEILPVIVDAYFPRDMVCIGRAFLHRLALVTLKLKSIIVPHVEENQRKYLDAYKVFFRRYKDELEKNAETVSLDIAAKLFPKLVVVLDD